MRGAILTLCAAVAIAASAASEQQSTKGAHWSLAIDTADGNEWIADRGLTLDDCAAAAVEARSHRPARTGNAAIMDIVCIPAAKGDRQ